MDPMILFAVFAAILVVTFGVVALFGGSQKDQELVEKRVLSILVPDPNDLSGQPELQLLLKARPTGQFWWLNELLQKYPVSKMLETRIIQANSKISPAKLFLSTLGLAVAGFAIASWFFHIVVIQMLAAATLGYIPFGYLTFKRSRRINAFNAALPDAIDMMGRALRAGHSMSASISIVAEQSVEPVRSEFSEVFKQQNFGIPIRDALGQMLEHVPSQDLRVLVTGILVQKDTGGNLAEILDRTANTIRERLKIQGEIRTHTAQGRMTGYILCALPVVMLVIINLINPGYSNLLLNTEVGQKLIYVGLGLLVTGGLIIRQIIHGIEV